jgi:hypothetical protein
MERMKRMAATLAGATVLVLTLAGTAMAQYVSPPPPTTIVKGSSGGTAFTGGNIGMPVMIAIALVVVGLAALFVARRRAASQA